MRERRRLGRASRVLGVLGWTAVAACGVGCVDEGDADAPLGGARQAIQLAAGADTYVRSGSPNQNQGAETTFRLQSSGHNRGLIRVEQGAIGAAIGSGTLVSAHLELTVAHNAENWGTTGRTIDLHA